LVTTPDDFGVTGATPSHPELLDHLAVEFMEHGWSTKWLVRSLVLSRAYRMDSVGAAGSRERDGPQWSRCAVHGFRRRRHVFLRVLNRARRGGTADGGRPTAGEARRRGDGESSPAVEIFIILTTQTINNF
jgi:hypothetical protein